MPQIFRPYANFVARYGIVGSVLLLVGVVYMLVRFNESPWQNEREVYRTQPVPFSHEHHVGGLGIDCRYCHTSVEVSSSAGMPATHTCMSCHAQLWTESEMLAPVRASLRTNQPIQWQRVYNLPDYVYFNHSIHVSKGVACETCHGRVDLMPLPYKANTLYMDWCLDCHRQPTRYLRPQEYIYAFGYALPEAAQRTLGQELVERYNIRTEHLTDCSICHR